MPLVFTEGFDFYTSASSTAGGMVGNGWIFPSSSATPPNTFITGRFGGRALANTVRSGASYTWNSYRVFKDGATDGVGLTGSFGFAFRPQTASAYRIGALGQDGSVSLMVFLTAAGEISIWRGDATALLGTSAGAGLGVGIWKYIEIEFFINDTTGTVKVYVENALVLDVTATDTRQGAETTFNSWRVVSSGDVNVGDYDDMYLTNSATRFGPCRVETLRPDADTATKQWTPNSGVINFNRVNEAVVDGDTTYNESGVIGNRDLYDLGDLSSAPAAIHTVNFIGCMRKTDAGSRSAALSIKSGASDTDSSALALAANYTYTTRYMDLNPDGSVAWTPAAVNAVQAGPKVIS